MLRAIDPVIDIAASEDVLARWPGASTVLTAAENARACQLHRRQDRDDFVAAHLLARECVARRAGGAAADVVLSQRCERCGGPHGRPTVTSSPGIQVSWAHSAGVVAAVASDRPVGVDVEALDAVGSLPDGLFDRVGTADEAAWVRAEPDPGAALLRLWVQKEALVKVGALTLDDFRLVRLDDVTGYDLEVLARPDAVVAVAVRS